MKKKAPEIDTEAIARQLIAQTRNPHGIMHGYTTEFYKHALDIKRRVPTLDPDMQAHISRNVFIREEWMSYIDDKGKKRRFKGRIYGYQVNVNYRAEIQTAAILGSLQEFCNTEQISMQIGSTRIEAS